MFFDIPLHQISWIDVASLYVLIAGYIIGLGAVTVIDLHGLLGRHSNYWTEATTRTHKITKPLIWVGMMLAIIGGVIIFRDAGITSLTGTLIAMAAILILNGCFLSFRVSPFLLKREKDGRSDALLPADWQKKITASFLVSFTGWWGSLFLIVFHLTTKWS